MPCLRLLAARTRAPVCLTPCLCICRAAPSGPGSSCEPGSLRPRAGPCRAPCCPSPAVLGPQQRCWLTAAARGAQGQRGWAAGHPPSLAAVLSSRCRRRARAAPRARCRACRLQVQPAAAAPAVHSGRAAPRPPQRLQGRPARAGGRAGGAGSGGGGAAGAAIGRRRAELRMPRGDSWRQRGPCARPGAVHLLGEQGGAPCEAR